MPPPTVKTIRQIIFYQYAKIISESSGMGKKNYGMIMSIYKKLCNDTMSWSSSVREWACEREHGTECIYCGALDKLTTDHILPRSSGGEDIPDNVVSVCKSCNSSKGSKGLYEWRGLDAKDDHHRIAEGKYLKYLYSLHDKQGTLNTEVNTMCPLCTLEEKCIKGGHENKLTVYCIEGCFLKTS
ncbi:MAG: HNH endonuclease [Oscillospiraceae bacterium]|nr:HNH endonuclease [Oscillospiraceae bacterium]